MKATHRLINSVWTVEYEIVSPTEVRIINFTRDDPEGYEREKELPQATVVEDLGRTVVGLLIRDKPDSFAWVNEKNCDHKYTVINPQHVFSYRPVS
jgi:hypothetical protein